MVFRFKCYNLPFFGWWDGHVDKYSLSSFFSHVILRILSQYVQNYRPLPHLQVCIIFFFKYCPARDTGKLHMWYNIDVSQGIFYIFKGNNRTMMCRQINAEYLLP